ncbi:uncharacterized protein LOC114658168 [Erpetoichthys calabaricus]|uniref:Uncharacterized LOC114658168 n=1 Tax=Erpetoichthys calabaricus TaxID=27687 RepID=A0A8C4SS91_ERPCA|nr:uncharacterized protein LOC114658168 [Erpetoichthys calabaricus]
MTASNITPGAPDTNWNGCGLTKLRAGVLPFVVLLLGWSLPQSSGWLLYPQNVWMLSEDFSSTIYWQPAPENPNDTNYTVEICSRSPSYHWIGVDGCVNISSNSCNLSKHFEDLYLIYFVRVKAVWHNNASDWAFVSFQPYKDSNLSMPQIIISLINQTIKVDVFHALAPFWMSMKATVSLFKDEDLNKTMVNTRSKHFEKGYGNLTITFENVPPGKYCISGFVEARHKSEQTEKQCISLGALHSGPGPLKIVFSIVAALLLLLLLALPLLLRFFCYVKPRISDLHFPKTLDFLKKEATLKSNNRHLNVTSERSNILPHYTPILIISSQSPARQRAEGEQPEQLLQDGYGGNNEEYNSYPTDSLFDEPLDQKGSYQTDGFSHLCEEYCDKDDSEGLAQRRGYDSKQSRFGSDLELKREGDLESYFQGSQPQSKDPEDTKNTDLQKDVPLSSVNVFTDEGEKLYLCDRNSLSNDLSKVLLTEPYSTYKEECHNLMVCRDLLPRMFSEEDIDYQKSYQDLSSGYRDCSDLLNLDAFAALELYTRTKSEPSYGGYESRPSPFMS